MTVTVTVAASCLYTSSNQPRTGAPSTVTVSCTPGSGKLYTARIENGNPAVPMQGKNTTSLNTDDIDASTRVFTISGRNDQMASSAGDGFIRLSLNY